MSFTDAGEIYVLLTIGDGLVAQIPSLVLSLATAIVVTRVTTSESMTDQTTGQLANPGALFITAGILTLLGIIPGMPSMVFIMLAAICAAIGYLVYRSNPRSDESEDEVFSSQSAAGKMSIIEHLF